VRQPSSCHSDLHIGKAGLRSRPWPQAAVLKRPRRIAAVEPWGNETVGAVLAFGPDARPTYRRSQVATLTLVYPWLGCGNAKVASAGEEICAETVFRSASIATAGYADHMTVPSPNICSISQRPLISGDRGPLPLLRRQPPTAR